MQTKHETVMHLDEEKSSERDEVVVFTNDDGESDNLSDLTLDWDVWVRMHRPDTITMTVVPGDALNIGGTEVEGHATESL